MPNPYFRSLQPFAAQAEAHLAPAHYLRLPPRPPWPHVHSLDDGADVLSTVEDTRGDDETDIS